MNDNRKILGILPIHVGDWSLDKTPYSYLNNVYYLGCTFQSKINNNSSVPATINDSGQIVINDNWQPIAIGSNGGIDEAKLNRAINDINDINNKITNVDNTSDLDKPISRLQGLAMQDITSSLDSISIELNNHKNNNNNPHNLNKNSIGLNNVDNTSDLDKPISNLTREALDNKLDKNSNDTYTFSQNSILYANAKNIISNNRLNDISISYIGFNSGTLSYFPTIVNRNNILYCAYRVANVHEYSANGYINILRSEDSGTTWIQHKVISKATIDLRDPIIDVVSGRIILFYTEYTAERNSKRVVIYSDDTENYSDPVTLPTPKGVNDYSGRGNCSVINNVVYCILYTSEGLGFTVKSIDRGYTWECLGYVSTTHKINETSIAYDNISNTFYLVARQQIYKEDSLPFKDYKNLLLSAKSKDCITWTDFNELPVYGHAPSLKVISDGTLLLSYKNTNIELSVYKNQYTLELAIMRNGFIDSSIVVVSKNPNFDRYYTDTAIINNNVIMVSHSSSSRIDCYKFLKSELINSFIETHVHKISDKQIIRTNLLDNTYSERVVTTANFTIPFKFENSDTCIVDFVFPETYIPTWIISMTYDIPAVTESDTGIYHITILSKKTEDINIGSGSYQVIKGLKILMKSMFGSLTNTKKLNLTLCSRLIEDTP